MYKSIFFAFIFFQLSFSQISVSGIVLDNENNPLPFLSVGLYDDHDNPKKISFSGIDGKFFIEEVIEGNYIFIIKNKDEGNLYSKQMDVYGNVDMGELVLPDEVTHLKAVTLYEDKNNIKMEGDRIILTVDKSYKANTLKEIIATLPGIYFYGDKINVAGKGNVGILINGSQKRNMTQQQLTNYLNSINADQIKKVELITNPPAKYSSNGNVAFINVILKKGNYLKVIERLNYSRFYRNNSTILYAISKKKINAEFSINNGVGSTFNYTSNNINDRTQNTFMKNGTTYLSPYLTLNYQMKKDININFSYYGDFNFLDVMLDNSNKYKDAGVEKEIKSKTISDKTTITGNSFDFIVSKEFSKYDKLSLTFSSLKHFSPKITKTTNDIGDLNLKQYAKQDIVNYSVSLDFTNRLFKKIDINYGADVFITRTDNRLDVSGNISQSNKFKFKEDVYSGYLSFKYNFFNKIYSNIQLRLEDTHLLGVSKIKKELDLSYLKLFPTISLTHTINKKTSLSVTYNRRYSRPSFESMDPFKIYVNSTSYAVGNPGLLPSFSNNLDAKLKYDKILFSIFYNGTTQGYGQIMRAYNSNNTITYERENHYNKYNYGLSFNYSNSVKSWMRYSVSLRAYRFENHLKENLFPISKLSYYGYSSMSILRLSFFNKKRTLYGNINAWYRYGEIGSVYGVGDISNVSLDLKYIPNKKFIFMVQVYDIFRKSYPTLSNIAISENNTTLIGGYNYQRLTFSLTYTIKGRENKTKKVEFLNKSIRDRLSN